MRAIARCAALAAAGIAILGPGPQARACSICLAGDPIFDAQGAGAQERGHLTTYLETRTFEKKSGHIPAEEHEGEEEDHEHEIVEENTNSRLRLLVAWTPLDRLTLSVDVPAVSTQIVETGGHEVAEISTFGLGDVTTSGAVVLWRNRDVLPSLSVEARSFVKAPTGESREATRGVRDKHVQPGTGSWDFGGGLAATQRFAWGTLYASALYRENTAGSLDYEYGDVVLANLAATAPLGHLSGIPALDRLMPGLELNYRYAQKDRFSGGRFQDSGGSILYVTPSLRFQVPWFEGPRAPSLRAAVQVPVTQAWLHGFQREGEVWTAGVVVPY